MNEHKGLELRLPIKGKSILTVIIVIIIIAIAAGTMMYFKGRKSAAEKYETVIEELEAENEKLSDPVAQYEIASQEINIDLINSEIQDIGELATVEYLFTDAGKYEDSAELFGQDVPFTKKSFIIKWNGTVKAGVRIEEVTAEVDRANKEIVVHIPPAEILSYDPDTDSVEILDEKSSIFNPVKVGDVKKFDAISEDAMKQRAIENGILEKAFENAKKIIQNMLYTDLVKELDFKITFQEM